MQKQKLALLFLVATLIAPKANAGFFGPDKEPLSPEQIKERMTSTPFSIDSGGVQLDIHTKSAAVGSFLVSFLVGSAIGSSGGGGTPNNAAQMQRQMQAHADIAQHTSANLQKVVTEQAAKSAGAAAAEQARTGPLPLVKQRLESALREMQANLAEAGAKPEYTLKLSQDAWTLDFSTFSSDYALSTTLSLEFRNTQADKIHYQHTCTKIHPQKLPLEAWEQDEHLAIAQGAEDLARDCYREFATALRLPLPPETANVLAAPPQKPAPATDSPPEPAPADTPATPTAPSAEASVGTTAETTTAQAEAALPAIAQ